MFLLKTHKVFNNFNVKDKMKLQMLTTQFEKLRMCETETMIIHYLNSSLLD